MIKKLTIMFIGALFVALLAACSSNPTPETVTEQSASAPETVTQPSNLTPETVSEQPTSTPESISQPASGSEQVDVKIANFAFTPETLTVKVGTTVKWINEDSAPHTVTSDAGDWDSGNLNTGSSFTHTFDQVGTFTYHCGLHAGMKATIEVTP